jgi:hypothetical protein
MGQLDGVVTVLARLVGAALLGVMAGIHVHLWLDGYRYVDTIGPLFLANGVLGGLAAVVVGLAPRRWLGLAAAGGAVLEAGTLAGLGLSLTSAGLFGFYESTQAELVVETLWVESAGVVVLGALAGRELLRRRRRRSQNPAAPPVPPPAESPTH